MFLWHYFWQLISRHQTATKAVETTTVCTSQLPRLPPELLLSIADMLPLPSAACLALCSRRLSCVLGPSVWTSLRIEAPEARLAFLSSLSMDLPQYIVCFDCVCLHRSSAILWPRDMACNKHPRCLFSYHSYGPAFLSIYRIYFPHIHLAMKYLYCGPGFGIPLEAFRHTEVTYDTMDQTLGLISVDAQIVSNKFLMRSQSWIVLPWSRRGELLEHIPLHGLCYHINMRSKDKRLPDIISLRVDQLEAQGKCPTQTLQCSECCMDYMVDAVDFGKRGFALIVTRWTNLGAGLSPEDAKWHSHQVTSMPQGLVHHPHSLGSIQASFKRQAKLSMEEFTAENKLKLFTRGKPIHLVTQGSESRTWKWEGFKYTTWYLVPSGPPTGNMFQQNGGTWLDGMK